MKAVIKTSLADLRRRKLQSAIVAVVVLLSTLAGTVALDLLVETDAPFDHAFAQSNGAHLTVEFDPSLASDGQLRATASLASVAAAAGPWHEAPLEVTEVARTNTFLDVVGRSDPGGPVDQLQVVTGRWASANAEIVLARRTAQDLNIAVGDRLTPFSGQGVDSLQVVGIAATVNDLADGWVTPAQLGALHPMVITAKGTTSISRAIMMYRLRSAVTHADIDAAANQIAHHLPANAVVGTSNWLDQKLNADITTSVMIPFLVAFSVFALIAAAVIIGNVVSGAVIAGYRDIGVMKSIGFTPLQVVSTVLLQIVIPGVLGAVGGVALGTLASQPFLAKTADAFNLPLPPPIVPWIIAIGVAVPIAVVLAAAFLPALRAARLSAAEALTAGSAPRLRRGYVAVRLLARLHAPRAITLGAGDALARPVRSTMTLIAIVIGVATITFAAGLTTSLDMVKQGLTRNNQVQVDVRRDNSNLLGVPAMTDAQVVALLGQQTGTARYVASGQLHAHVPNIGAPLPVYGYRGDSGWIGYPIISGHWFTGPGEAVAPTAFFTAAGVQIGDSVTLTGARGYSTVRLVGEIFDVQNNNQLIRTDWSTLLALDPSITPDFYEVHVAGTPPDAYVASIANATNGYAVDARPVGGQGLDVPFLLIESAVAGLALVLTLCALAGVFNTVVLNTREKARDTAILKTLGMTPRQVVLMVLTSVGVVSVAGAAVGIPLGMAMQHQILIMMGNIAASTAIPPPFFSVYPALLLAGLAAIGIGVALLGAWAPARWAARSKIAGLLAPE